jgi:hypothetical protein
MVAPVTYRTRECGSGVSRSPGWKPKQGLTAEAYLLSLLGHVAALSGEHIPVDHATSR